MLEEGFLKVSELHTIYYSTYGNKNGIPLLMIHGGPGGYSKPYKNLFGLDLNKFYVILYDQRGCGKSIPSGELKENTTIENVDDIARLLDFFKIKNIVIKAASWGTVLALVFAIKYPHRVLKMFLGSTFLARKIDSDWLFNNVKTIFPDLYDNFIQSVPVNERKNIAEYLYNKLQTSNFKEQQTITAMLDNYERTLMKIVSSKTDIVEPDDIEEKNINSAKIFLYYEKSSSFLEDNFIINNSDKIKNIPITFYHGRYDLDCPINGVYELHKKLENSELIIVPYEGHNGVMLKELLINDLNRLKI